MRNLYSSPVRFGAKITLPNKKLISALFINYSTAVAVADFVASTINYCTAVAVADVVASATVAVAVAVATAAALRRPRQHYRRRRRRPL